MSTQTAIHQTALKARLPRIVTRVRTQDLPSLPRPIALTCERCGTTCRYDVGTIVLSPDLRKADTPEEIESCIGFSNIFRCRTCGTGGPWRLPEGTLAGIVLLVTAKLTGSDDVPVMLGALGTFDGHCHRYGSEGEDHLRGLLAREPNSAFLWVRLGNLHSHAGSPDEAETAYQRALELEPNAVEAHAMYGQLLRDHGQELEAVPHWHAILKHIRDARDLPKKLRREIIHCTLASLLAAHAKSKGAFELFPKTDPAELPEPPNGEPRVLDLRDFDLSTERGMREMCDMFLGERRCHSVADAVGRWIHRRRVVRIVPPLPATRLAPFASAQPSAPAPREHDPRIGRNAPCPCGSGHKYKKCCGK